VPTTLQYVIHTDVVDLSASVATVEGDVATVASDIATVNTNIATMTSSISTVNTNIATMTSSIATVNTNIATMTSNDAQVKSDIASLKADVASIVSTLKIVQASLRGSSSVSSLLQSSDGCSYYPSVASNGAIANCGSGSSVATITGQAGKQISVNRIGMCGDNRSSSGPNTFQLNDGSTYFTWHAGYNSGSAANSCKIGTYLGNTIDSNPSSWIYKNVAFTGACGASVKIYPVCHLDWDGVGCGVPDEDGTIYADPLSSTRTLVKYKMLPCPASSG